MKMKTSKIMALILAGVLVLNGVNPVSYAGTDIVEDSEEDEESPQDKETSQQSESSQENDNSGTDESSNVNESSETDESSDVNESSEESSSDVLNLVTVDRVEIIGKSNEPVVWNQESQEYYTKADQIRINIFFQFDEEQSERPEVAVAVNNGDPDPLQSGQDLYITDFMNIGDDIHIKITVNDQELCTESVTVKQDITGPQIKEISFGADKTAIWSEEGNEIYVDFNTDENGIFKVKATDTGAGVKALKIVDDAQDYTHMSYEITKDQTSFLFYVIDNLGNVSDTKEVIVDRNAPEIIDLQQTRLQGQGDVKSALYVEEGSKLYINDAGFSAQFRVADGESGIKTAEVLVDGVKNETEKLENDVYTCVFSAEEVKKAKTITYRVYDKADKMTSRVYTLVHCTEPLVVEGVFYDDREGRHEVSYDDQNTFGSNVKISVGITSTDNQDGVREIRLCESEEKKRTIKGTDYQFEGLIDKETLYSDYYFEIESKGGNISRSSQFSICIDKKKPNISVEAKALYKNSQEETLTLRKEDQVYSIESGWYSLKQNNQELMEITITAEDSNIEYLRIAKSLNDEQSKEADSDIEWIEELPISAYLESRDIEEQGNMPAINYKVCAKANQEEQYYIITRDCFGNQQTAVIELCIDNDAPVISKIEYVDAKLIKEEEEVNSSDLMLYERSPQIKITVEKGLSSFLCKF